MLRLRQASLLATAMLYMSVTLARAEKVYERWSGDFQFSSFSCSSQGSKGIIIEGVVSITSYTGEITIDCDELHFRTAGQLRLHSNSHLTVNLLQGPVRIEAIPLEQNISDGKESNAAKCEARAAFGMQGQSGTNAVARQTVGANKSRSGGDGSPGLLGRRGRNGKSGLTGLDGPDGPDVKLVVGQFGLNTSLIVSSTGGHGEQGGTGFSGCSGGNGGAGGSGGSGLKGRLFSFPGAGGNGGNGAKGGNGGNGGSGGKGGQGGSGGDIQIVLRSESFALNSQVEIAVNSKGGAPGSGGIPGLGGQSGNGGEGGKGGTPGLAFANRTLLVTGERHRMWGCAGRIGVIGYQGKQGSAGLTGEFGGSGSSYWAVGDLDMQSVLKSLKLQ